MVMILRHWPSGHSVPWAIALSFGQSAASFFPRLLLRKPSPLQNGYAWCVTALGVEK
jgi:hypothetical protein